MPNKDEFVYGDIPFEMRALYDKMTKNGVGSWDKIGKLIGVSGPYARMLALKIRPLTTTLAVRWLRNVESFTGDACV